jgi:hypothetical protein
MITANSNDITVPIDRILDWISWCPIISNNNRNAKTAQKIAAYTSSPKPKATETKSELPSAKRTMNEVIPREQAGAPAFPIESARGELGNLDVVYTISMSI